MVLIGWGLVVVVGLLVMAIVVTLGFRIRRYRRRAERTRLAEAAWRHHVANQHQFLGPAHVLRVPADPPRRPNPASITPPRAPVADYGLPNDTFWDTTILMRGTDPLPPCAPTPVEAVNGQSYDTSPCDASSVDTSSSDSSGGGSTD